MTGEYEPADSRNVTGTATGSGGRWSQDNPVEPPRTGVREQATRPGEQQQQADAKAGESGGAQGGAASTALSQVREHMEVIGADGVHVGTVDHVEGNRIKLTRKDSGMGSHQGHHHYVAAGLVAGVEGDKVRLSASGANAYALEEEE